jgi:hypothetical protein
MFDDDRKNQHEYLRDQALMVAMVLNGEDPDDAREDNKSEVTQSIESVPSTSPSFPMFQSPEVYKSWTPEKRQAETERMMGIHKSAVRDLATKRS